MKKVIKPSTKEESVRYSDFSGKCFGDFDAPVNVKFSFNYGSEHDGSEFELDLTDEEASLFIEIIQAKLSEDRKKEIKRTLDRLSTNLDEACLSRDFDTCDSLSSSVGFLRCLLK